MRLRHIKGCEDFITDAKECIREDKAIELKGSIQDIFEEKRALQIEIGMGKGQFIRNMAIAHPDINFIGIEKYESVLMKAIKRQTCKQKTDITGFFKCVRYYIEKGRCNRI